MNLFRCGRYGWLLVLATVLASVSARGQGSAAVHVARTETVPVVMLSDLHFDPFRDPGKVAQLRATPESGWQAIFAGPATATQAADWAKLYETCKTRGLDTDWTLLEASLSAAGASTPHAAFVTVSGDLMAHEFDCKFKAMAPKASEGEYSAFAAKTVAYVAAELRRAFPQVPVYVALGNNDSGCGDYHETEGSRFLTSVAASLRGDMRAKAAKSMVELFDAGGGYSVRLPKPVVRGRLIVLQDLFLTRKFATCEGEPDATQVADQLAWLQAQLTGARARHEQVWVMAHVPPGVDVYSTFSHSRDVCAGQKPEMFLANEKIVEVLTQFADVVRLGLFAHSHMDEMRLYPAAEDRAHAGPVALKLVPSISPVNGNNPAFTLAEVEAATATLRDYRVMAASNQTGVATAWAEEYRYSTTYGLKDFSVASLTPLMAGFAADKGGTSAASAAYEKNFFVGAGAGARALAMRLVWPAYVCSMTQNTGSGYRGCLCPAPEPTP